MSDSLDNELEYQEQILDDLDEIKGSLNEESEFYDKKYQKEVLQSLKAIQKSVEDLTNYDLVLLSPSGNFSKESIINKNPQYSNSEQVQFNYYASPLPIFVYYDVSDYDYIRVLNNASTSYAFGYFLSDVTPSSIQGYGTTFKISGSYISELTDPISVSDFEYFYYNSASSDSSYFPSVYGYVESNSGGDDPLPEEPVEVVTTSSAVIIEGLENLTQITTFQSFCSSLLIGILLFLVFVKGLRK